MVRRSQHRPGDHRETTSLARIADSLENIEALLERLVDQQATTTTEIIAAFEVHRQMTYDFIEWFGSKEEA